MQSGQKQYETEGEPVSRHLAKLKKETGKDAYCLFIAPKINESCIAYFYALHTMNIAFYGGKSVIVPLELDVFINMVEQSYNAGYVPNPQQVKSIFEYSLEQAKNSVDENEWYFKGHFPGNPIMPGVLIAESLAQAGAVAILSQEENIGKNALFGGIDKMKFKKMVVPGDKLKLEVKIIKKKGPIGVGEGIATVNRKASCQR